MSLCTDKFFYLAISQHSSPVIVATDGRIYNTADDSVEKEDDTKVPYVIITNNGGQNISEDKDDVGESETDSDNMSIEIAASTREELAYLAKEVRLSVKRAFAEQTGELGFDVIDYTMNYGPVNFDAFKPCFWMILNYTCETTAEE